MGLDASNAMSPRFEYNRGTMQDILCKTDCGHSMKAHKSKALLVLRIAAGIIFIMHGYGKLTGNPSIEMFSGMLANMGWPAPMFFAWVVALVEFFGGIAILFGILTRPAAILLAIDMLVAFLGAKHGAFPAGDPDFALLGISIALALMGPGRCSIAKMMMKDHGGNEGGCKNCNCGNENCKCGEMNSAAK